MIENLFLFLIGFPFFWLLLLAIIFFSRLPVKEKILSESVKIYSMSLAITSFILFVVTLSYSPAFLMLDYSNWFEVGSYQFKMRFIVDLLGSTYAFLTTALIGIILKFSRNYLHREEGYFRFLFLMSTLMFGLIVVCFSRSLDVLFIGWELVGTTSVLLIGYFLWKPQPVVHATKAIISYRLCDAGILAAAAWCHIYLHTHDFKLFTHHLKEIHGGPGLYFIGLFVLWASLAKAGQLPMSSWLPAAMEGPTPSSAIFYGALSVHLGPFLLLRFYEFFAHFPMLLIIIGMIGTLSAFYATLVGRTRSDAKTMLAYATISQVGLIYVEIALGMTNFALFHIVTHASLRTYQFLRSGSLIQDFFENPIIEQGISIQRILFFERLFNLETRKKIFVHALHGFHLDFLTTKLVRTFLAPMKMYMNWEEKWMEVDTRILKFLLRKK
jgi:NADH-quinone oxidoreductase subunit L